MYVENSDSLHISHSASLTLRFSLLYRYSKRRW